MNRRYYVIDAFAAEPYTGNPAGVVFGADGLDDDAMQQIAAEFGFSETTFVLPPQTGEALVRFRWFTPTVEVAMCGHATIAGLRALLEEGVVRHDDPTASTPVAIDTLSGTLTAQIENLPGGSGLMFWLDLPTPRLTPMPINVDALAPLLGLTVDALDRSLEPVRTQDDDVLVFVRDFMALHEAKPDFAKLERFQNREGLRGLCLATVHTLTPSIHVQSRFFAPAAGIHEDPVTGSVHGPLAAYLVDRELAPVRDGLAALTCSQSKAGGRAGLLHALVGHDENGQRAVRIAGQTVITMRGELL